jgi:hypothetical protein
VESLRALSSSATLPGIATSKTSPSDSGRNMVLVCNMVLAQGVEP